jgi:SNF2 family DNA or RNA helicase
MEYNLRPDLQREWLAATSITKPWPWHPKTRDRLLEAASPEAEFHGARGALLADPPGSGKTIMSLLTILASVQERVRQGHRRFGSPTMIVVPKRLLQQWIAQLHQHFSPGVLTVHVARADTRTTAVASILEADLDYVRYCIDVVLTTYETLRCAMRAALYEEEGDPTPDDDDDTETAVAAMALPPHHPARQRGLFGLSFQWLVCDEAVYRPVFNRFPPVFDVCVILPLFLPPVEPSVDRWYSNCSSLPRFFRWVSSLLIANY